MTDHWVDRLSQDLARRVSRRRFFLLPGLLAAGPALSGAAAAGAGKQRRRKKDACDKYFKSKKNRNHCRFIRRQCKVAGNRTFCILEGDPKDPAKIADCCVAGQVCCALHCCGPFLTPAGDFEGGRCCPGNPQPRKCIPASWTCCPDNRPDANYHSAPPGASCCRHDRRGFCAANERCCPGLGCVLKGTRENCGGCGVHCGALGCLDDATCGCGTGLAECNGVCYNIQTQCCHDGRILPIGSCP